jgi:uncharacterized membrane protein
MSRREATPERLGALSDAVFAILITILVLDLKAPEAASVEALLSLWPRGLSYAVSYLFVAIVWINHHFLFRYASQTTPRLLWGNFAHLFTVSLVPFATAWIAETKLGAIPVALYAAIFLVVNATYLVLCAEAVERAHQDDLPHSARKLLRRRSLTTLVLFAVAALTALRFPLGGMALVCLCLVFYLRPEPPGSKLKVST